MWKMTEQILVLFQSRIKFYWEIKLMKAPMGPCSLFSQSRCRAGPCAGQCHKGVEGENKTPPPPGEWGTMASQTLQLLFHHIKMLHFFSSSHFSENQARLEVTGSLRVKRATSTSGIQCLNRRFKQCFKLKLQNKICILSDIKAISCWFGSVKSYSWVCPLLVSGGMGLETCSSSGSALGYLKPQSLSIRSSTMQQCPPHINDLNICKL